MSYILDALRKADAQRVRDPARGIHAQGAAAPPGPAADTRGPAVWVWSAGVVLLLALAAWYWSRGDDPVPAPVRTSAPAPAATALPIEAARVPPPATAVFPPPPPVVIAAPVQPPPEVRPPAVPKPQKEPAPVAGLPGQSPAAVVPAPAAAPAPDRTYSLAELPADVQQALPKLSVSGGVYSANVAQRMLIVNGQVFNEGSEVAPGVVLEQIRPNVALLRFRGLRITQPY